MERRSTYAAPSARTHAGFTARELILVVAIIVVLVGAIVPIWQYESQKAEDAAVCLHHRTIVAHVLSFPVQAVGSENITQSDFASAVSTLGDQEACPAGGSIYMVKDDKTGHPKIFCTYHTDNVEVTADPDSYSLE